MYDFYLVQSELDVTWYVDLYGEFIKIGGGLIIIIIIISSTYISPHKIAYTQIWKCGLRKCGLRPNGPKAAFLCPQNAALEPFFRSEKMILGYPNLLIEIFITLKNS